nr:PAS domain-containing sensor histidine kinase [Bacteroidota bacterium]
PLGECVLLLNARLIFAEKIKEQLILLAFSDITERKLSEHRKKELAEELEVKVKTRTQQLEQTNILLDQYTYTASHEFQEPLRKIITISNLLKDIDNKSDPEEVKEYLNKIEGASVRMRKLIHDMLNFASVKNIETLLVETDLNEIFKNILFDFELLIEEKNAKIIVGKLPKIEAVPFQMNQLFYDLISNALKFSKKSSPPVIEISAHKLTKEEMKLNPVLNQNLIYNEIIINDNGIGFDQKYARQIFIMFQRLVTDSTYAGTGIGLAMCKKIVQTYHGDIFAKGTENIGATFHVILPTQQPKNSL